MVVEVVKVIQHHLLMLQVEHQVHQVKEVKAALALQVHLVVMVLAAEVVLVL